MRERTMTVEDLMSTALVTAKADELLSEIDLEMKLADIRHIPIVDDRNRLIGIVSQRDLLRAMARSDRRPVAIRSVMTTRVWTVPPDAPAAEAVDILLSKRIGSVPVVRDDGELVGIVTESDFLDLARSVLTRGPTRAGRSATL